MKSWLVAVNVFRRIIRDPRTLVLVVLTPLFFILLYGVSFSSSPKNVDLIVVNLDQGRASVRTQGIGRIEVDLELANSLVQQLDTAVFNVILETAPEAAETARESVRSGEAWGALILPRFFTNALANEALRRSGPRTIEIDGQQVTVLPDEVNEDISFADLIIDDSNPLIAAGILPALNAALSDALASALSAEDADLPSSSDLINIEPIYDQQVDDLDYTAPGVIGFAIMLISIMLTSISIVRERTSGTLTRLLIAPVRAWEVSIGYVVAFLLIGLVQAAELFLVSYFLFDIRFVGSPIWVALIILLFTIGLQGVATLISTLAKNEFQAMQFILVILIPSIMLAGVFWPIETMPTQIQPITMLNPLTHANSALRDVMLRGWEISAITTELAILGGFALLMLILSIQSMKRQAHSG